MNCEETKKIEATEVPETEKAITTTTSNPIVSAMDANGDGQVDITDVIMLSMRIPGIKIKREDFIRTQLKK